MLFTYTAVNEPRTDEETYYEFHLDEVQKCIEEFIFESPTASDTPKTEYIKDEDGYLLYSDSKLSGFDLYVHPDFELDYASAIVSATHKDGSNVNMTETNMSNVYVNEYWKNKKAELSAIVTDIKTIKENEPASFGNITKMSTFEYAYAYEYTFRYNGKDFHVYQVLCAKGLNGYVFTYTAREEVYAEHIDEIMTIIDKAVIK